MTELARQKNWRKRNRELGLVDIRVEVPLDLREALKALAEAHDSTLKEEVIAALLNHVNRRNNDARKEAKYNNPQ